MKRFGIVLAVTLALVVTGTFLARAVRAGDPSAPQPTESSLSAQVHQHWQQGARHWRGYLLR